MAEVYVASDNIITALGFTTSENLKNIENGKSGIKINNDATISQSPFYSSVVDRQNLLSEFERSEIPPNGNQKAEEFTKLEKMFILSVTEALKDSRVNAGDKKTLFIISTTKGNIDLLKGGCKNNFDNRELRLWDTAYRVQHYFQNPNQPLVISNACISGLLAIITAYRLIQSGQYENVIVTGGDVLSEFIISGFQSFLAISPKPCKPFDIRRDGLTMGEGCGTIILTSNQSRINNDKEFIKISGGAISNDANHISGPSTTGEGLFIAIKNAMKEAETNSVNNIDYISAHGSATVYNDEMESKAFNLAGFEDTPLNSFKGYWGHTLGAAGIIESIAAIHSMRKNVLYKTAGFNELGVPKKINVLSEFKKAEISNCLKTASGFGGCNAAVVFSKEN